MNTDAPTLREALIAGVLIGIPGALFAWLFTALLQAV